MAGDEASLKHWRRLIVPAMEVLTLATVSALGAQVVLRDWLVTIITIGYTFGLVFTAVCLAILRPQIVRAHARRLAILTFLLTIVVLTSIGIWAAGR